MRDRVACFTVIFTALAVFSQGKQKIADFESALEWQEGTLLSSDEGAVYVGTLGNTTMSATDYGSEIRGEATTDSRAIYRVYEFYVIRAGRYVYVGKERLRWRWSRPARLTVNGPVDFAVEGDRLYIVDEAGKHHDMLLVKTVLLAEERVANPAKPADAATPMLVESKASPATTPTKDQTDIDDKARELAKSMSVVSFTSVPTGADITVDGKFVGNTPTTLKLPPGEHVISMSKLRFKAWQKTLAVPIESTINVTATLEAAE